MEWRWIVVLLPVLAVFGCSGLRLHEEPSLVLDGIPIYGQVENIPEPTLRAAIVLDRRLRTGRPRKIYLIDVVSREELHVYHTPRNPRWEEYHIYKRIAGEWRLQDRVVGGSIRFP
jgi:hypothetical protein